MNPNIDSSVLDYLKSLTLLCVEDNKTTQLIYDAIFEDLVHKVVFAYDGEDGYKQFINEDIDIIISDYDMPILNGIDMIEKIRATDKNIPIILVTAIEEIDVIVKALQLDVDNFLKKPVRSEEVLHAIEKVTKILIANNYIKEQREKTLKDLEDKQMYHTYQEELAFAKELNILKNDFYYQVINFESTALIDFMYKPLDVVSGDAYSIREINEYKTFYIVVDGMGKGFSASLSAMLITSYINHLIDKETEFDLHHVIYESIEYIKPILLEEESLSIDYILLDCSEKKMSYAKFSMPPILMQTSENKIVKVKSNNPPLSRYTKDFNISSYDSSEIIKFLFYSDGMIENSTIFDDKLYMDFIQDDFLSSYTKHEMRDKFLLKIAEQEDDITFIFIHKLNLDNTLVKTKKFSSSLEEVENANVWYNNLLKTITTDPTLIYTAGVVFSELFMNAYEHGNLHIDSINKHLLIEEDKYFSTLNTLEKRCNKQITISVYTIEYMDNLYVITSISDEGEGFDTNILSDIFKNMDRYNGRGVFVSRRSSLGIFYNKKGNSVLFLHKV